jgi:hypothetical protein
MYDKARDDTCDDEIRIPRGLFYATVHGLKKGAQNSEKINPEFGRGLTFATDVLKGFVEKHGEFVCQK